MVCCRRAYSPPFCSDPAVRPVYSASIAAAVASRSQARRFVVSTVFLLVINAFDLDSIGLH